MSQNNPPQSCQIKTKELCDHQLQIVPLNYSGVQLELEECKIRVVKNEEMRNKRVSLWTVDEVCEWIKSHNPSHNSGFVAAIYGHAISDVDLHGSSKIVLQCGKWMTNGKCDMSEVLKLFIDGCMDC
ncbi:uncharacterized protein [Narcine bancroftii]|uniref:uncharacterized protein isoform X4 n=1 Tax=Narcine bancroftii TaxID=1343680 RepID=UPI003831287A